MNRKKDIMKKTKVYFTKEITSEALVKLYKKLNIEVYVLKNLR